MSLGAGKPTGCRIGFVGTGGVARRHASVLSGFPDVELVAATDLLPERAAEFAREYDVLAVDGRADLLAQGLDAVYVCVPPGAHGAVEVELAAAGVALFVEKPLAADLATAEWIERRLRARPVLTRVGHHWRCAEPVRRARELLAGRRIRLVAGTWVDKVPPVPWWTDRTRSGGPLVEQAAHVLDLARVLVGEVAEVHAASAGPVSGGSVDAATAAVLCFACGAVGTFGTSCAAPARHRTGLEIVADGLVVGVGEDWLEVHDADGRRIEEFDAWTPRVAADRAFVDALQGRVPDPLDPLAAPPDYREALRTHRLACTLARSAADATQVRVS